MREVAIKTLKKWNRNEAEVIVVPKKDVVEVVEDKKKTVETVVEPKKETAKKVDVKAKKSISAKKTQKSKVDSKVSSKKTKTAPKTTVEPLIEEARKYKSAEEFSEATHTIPIESIEIKQSILDEARNDISSGKVSRTPEKPLVVLMRQNGTLVLQDGYHRYAKALDSKTKTVQVIFETPSDTQIRNFYNQAQPTKNGVEKPTNINTVESNEQAIRDTYKKE